MGRTAEYTGSIQVGEEIVQAFVIQTKNLPVVVLARDIEDAQAKLHAHDINVYTLVSGRSLGILY